MTDHAAIDGYDRALLTLSLRRDLVSFIHRSFQTVSPGEPYQHNWHIEAIAWHLKQCRERNIKRLIITLPPRGLKSICASVAFPAWALGRDPKLRIICASYSNELTAKHARDCRAVMASAWYRKLFPKSRINPKKNTELEFETTARGYRLGTSVGGTLTGRGGNIIVIDDPMKPTEGMSDTKREAVKQWFDNTLYSRLDSKRDDVIILVMQRLHIDDLVGHVLAAEDWVHLDLPAIADEPQSIPIGDDEIHHREIGDVLHPEREPRETLEHIKETIGSQAFSAQYQQAPVPPGGALIKRNWFRFYRDPPHKSGVRMVQSWDTASKADEIHDYSVCTTWLVDGKDYYLIDVFRDRLEYPDLKRRVLTEAQHHGAKTVLIEDSGSGTHLIQELQRENAIRPIGRAPKGDKVTRMSAQSAKIEAGQVYLPERAPWLEDFLVEMMHFPSGRHDDQVDSVSQFLAWIDQGVERRVVPVRA